MGAARPSGAGFKPWPGPGRPALRLELGRPDTGVEFNPDGAELDIYPYGAITIEETEPIVAVTVIGSGCSSPSYVIIEAEPLAVGQETSSCPTRQGMHVRGDAWMAGVVEQV